MQSCCSDFFFILVWPVNCVSLVSTCSVDTVLMLNQADASCCPGDLHCTMGLVFSYQ